MTDNILYSVIKLANLQKSINSFSGVVIESKIPYKRVHLETFAPTQ